jgi:DNA-directed RNA polymerase specialized sigma subunit
VAIAKTETNEELAKQFQDAYLKRDSVSTNSIYEKMLRNNRNLLCKIISRTSYDKGIIGFDELRHLAEVALFNALVSYDSKKALFSTFAYKVIQNHIQEEIRNSDLVSVSKYFRDKGAKRMKRESFDYNSNVYLGFESDFT